MSQPKSPRDLLLEQIASEGYNVGYSASLHFATLDIASKVPTMVTVTSFAVGILGLVYPQLAEKLPSAILLIIGICMLYVRDYESRLSEYEQTGIKLNNLYKQLHDLVVDVRSVTAPSAAQLDAFRQRLIEVRTAASGLNVSPQIFGASWKAHHRFFWVIDSSWVGEHRNRKFSLRDKAPLSAFVLLSLIVLGLLATALHLARSGICQ